VCSRGQAGLLGLAWFISGHWAATGFQVCVGRTQRGRGISYVGTWAGDAVSSCFVQLS
jgi:hypothetical protein